ncbi:hypothetical protein ACEWPL_009875 [Roseovarius sp. S1116L3]|uniref:hypothetical protein n=1 Tax=Roseovarius roseus TaxID=3342636 RepID=UPI00372AAE10
MQNFAMPLSPCTRHARLFELIRQQNRAARIAQRKDAAPPPDPGALAEIARRAKASWQKLC